MSLRNHLLYGAAILAALVLFAWAERRAGAAEARAHATADSLASVTRALTVRADSALAHQRQDSISEVQRLKILRARDIQLATVRDSAGILLQQLQRAAPESLQAMIGALQAAQARAEAILSAQRDSALVLFAHAASQRDTLAGLVRQLQVQQQGLSTALAQASRKPIWEVPGVKIIEAALALKGVASLLGH